MAPNNPYGPRQGIRDAVKDDRARIWCNHCDVQTNQTCDTYRHYRNAHPLYQDTEKPYWVFELYINSRHGVGVAADTARLRRNQILSYLGGGSPVTAPPFGPAAQGEVVRATVASTLPVRSTQAQEALAGTPTAQAAPTTQAAPTAQAAPSASALAYHPLYPSSAGPPAPSHSNATLHQALPIPTLYGAPPPSDASSSTLNNALPTPRISDQPHHPTSAPSSNSVPGYLDFSTAALKGDNATFDGDNNPSSPSSGPTLRRKRTQEAPHLNALDVVKPKQERSMPWAALSTACMGKAQKNFARARWWNERAEKADPADEQGYLNHAAEITFREGEWWAKEARIFGMSAAEEAEHREKVWNENKLQAGVEKRQ